MAFSSYGLQFGAYTLAGCYYSRHGFQIRRGSQETQPYISGEIRKKFGRENISEVSVEQILSHIRNLAWVSMSVFH